MYVIYIDIIFLINIFMDLMIFYIASMVLNRPTKFMRMIIGSIMAALIYCMILYMPILQSLPNLLLALLIPALPILYMYKPLQIKEFFKIYLVCTGVAFILGGTTFSLWYLVCPDAGVHTMSVVWLIAIGFGVGISIYLSFHSIRKRFILPLFEYDIKIIHKHKEIVVKSILDTGNCLYTPLGNRPVIVVTYDALRGLFTNEQESIISEYKDNLLELITTGALEPSYIIPFNSVGCKSGMLLGIEVDKVYIRRDHFEKHVDKCIIAISFHDIFNDKTYHALLHPDFILN